MYDIMVSHDVLMWRGLHIKYLGANLDKIMFPKEDYSYNVANDNELGYA